MSIIKAEGLVKRYGALTAVAGITFQIESHECFGFLGSNGAGKTSTMRMIACVSPITEGRLEIDGLDAAARGPDIRATLGVVPQEDNLDEDVNVLQNLTMYARYFDIPKAERATRAMEALEYLELADRAHSRIDTLSGGMKRRLLIARGLLNRPKVLILDEPTTGLDPHARHLVWQRIRVLQARGTTMVLSTHHMEEAALLCNRVAIMDEGRILASGTPKAVIADNTSKEVVELRLAPWDKEKALAQLAGRVGAIADAGDALLLFDADSHPLDLGLDPEHTTIIRRRPNLEDVFLRLTRKGLR